MSPEMVDLRKAEPVREYQMRCQNKQNKCIQQCFVVVWLYTVFQAKMMCRLCAKHDLAFMAVTEGGVTWTVPPWQGIQKSFWPLSGRRKHTNMNLYNAPVRLCWVRI